MNLPLSQLWSLPTAFIIVFGAGVWFGLLLPHLDMRRKPYRKGNRNRSNKRTKSPKSGPERAEWLFDAKFKSTCPACDKVTGQPSG